MTNTENPEKDLLLEEIGDTLMECGVIGKALELRQLKTCKKVLETLFGLMEVRKDCLAKLNEIKFTKQYIAEAAGINRNTIGRTDYLEKIVAYYSPEDVKKCKQPQNEIETLKAKNKEMERIIKNSVGREYQIAILHDEIEQLNREKEQLQKLADSKMKEANDLYIKNNDLRSKLTNANLKLQQLMGTPPDQSLT